MKASACLQEAFGRCALDAANRIQRLAVPLPPPDVGQHIVAGLQPLHQQAVVGQRRQGGGSLDLACTTTASSGQGFSRSGLLGALAATIEMAAALKP